MKVRLMARDSKMPNIAIMQVATYYKQRGDDVDWYNALMDIGDTDILYESQIFDFTETFDYYPDCEIIKGGTGVDIGKHLPQEIEQIRQLDYSLYPNCNYTMQFYSRGCIRNCPFCVVRQKEGLIQSVEPFELNPNGKHIEILDNNFFANPSWRDAFKTILSTKQKVNLHGVDVRIINEEQAEALNKMKHTGQIHIAWDNPRTNLIPTLKETVKCIKPYKLRCYVLIGYDSTEEEDLYRVTELWNLGILPFVMPFNKGDIYQRRFARWVNHVAIFKTVKWEDYNKKEVAE